MQEQHSLVLLDFSLAAEVNEPCEGLAGINRVEHQPFLARHHAHCLKAFLGRLCIARTIVPAHIHLGRRKGNVLTHQLGGFRHELRYDLLKRILADGNARHGSAPAIKHCAKHHAGQRAAAACGADHTVNFHIRGLRLRENLLRALHIPKRAERHAAAHRHEIRFAACRAQLVRKLIHFSINIVIAVRIHKADIHIHKRLKQQVALASHYPTLFEHQDGLYSKLAAAGRCKHCMVGLCATRGNHHIAALLLRIRKQVFELAHLVAAKAHTGHVVPLDIDAAAEFRADVFELVKRRGQLCERNARNVVFHGILLLIPRRSGGASAGNQTWRNNPWWFLHGGSFSRFRPRKAEAPRS